MTFMQKINYIAVRTLFIPVFAAMLLSIAGCATSDKRIIFGGSPIAIVSMVTNNDINWKDEDSFSAFVAGRAIRRVMESDPDQTMTTSADTFIDVIESDVRSILDMSPFLTLVPAETVHGSSVYNIARSNPLHEKENLITPPGYRYTYYRDSKFFPSFAAETGITKTLFITFEIGKEMASGIAKFGNGRATVTMTVMLKDERGKTLFHKIYNSFSREKTKVTGGRYSQSEMQSLILSAIGDACYDLLDDIAY